MGRDLMDCGAWSGLALRTRPERLGDAGRPRLGIYRGLVPSLLAYGTWTLVLS